MKLKLGHSYLVTTDNSPSSMKAVVLDVTNTLYHIRWGNGDESWHSKQNFARHGALYTIQEELGAAVIIEPEEYRAVIRNLTNRLSDAAGFYEQLEKKDSFKVTPAYKRALFMDAQLFRRTIQKARDFIEKKPEQV
jgi:hypothetical protein